MHPASFIITMTNCLNRKSLSYERLFLLMVSLNHIPCQTGAEQSDDKKMLEQEVILNDTPLVLYILHIVPISLHSLTIPQ